MRAAARSAGRRGETLDGGSMSSRPLVKMPGGCTREEEAWTSVPAQLLRMLQCKATMQDRTKRTEPGVTGFMAMDAI